VTLQIEIERRGGKVPLHILVLFRVDRKEEKLSKKRECFDCRFSKFKHGDTCGECNCLPVQSIIREKSILPEAIYCNISLNIFADTDASKCSHYDQKK